MLQGPRRSEVTFQLCQRRQALTALHVKMRQFQLQVARCGLPRANFMRLLVSHRINSEQVMLPGPSSSMAVPWEHLVQDPVRQPDATSLKTSTLFSLLSLGKRVLDLVQSLLPGSKLLLPYMSRECLAVEAEMLSYAGNTCQQQHAPESRPALKLHRSCLTYRGNGTIWELSVMPQKDRTTTWSGMVAWLQSCLCCCHQNHWRCLHLETVEVWRLLAEPSAARHPDASK